MFVYLVMCYDSDVPWNRFEVGSVNQTNSIHSPMRRVAEHKPLHFGSEGF